MGQTLTHGIYLPDEGERNCYDGLAANWSILDGAVGTIAEHTSALAGKAPLVHTHVKSDITDFPAYGTTAGTICEGNDSRLSDARTPVAHTHTKSDVTDLLNSNFIPSANNSYDLGSSSYQWNNLYAKNYYYNGVAWGLNTFNQWTGNNKFVSPNTNFGFKSTTAEAGSLTAASNWIYWQDKNGFQDAYISRDIRNDGSDSLRIAITSKRSNGAPSTTGTEVGCGFRLNIHANGNTSIDPFDNGGTDLGTSTNKWKTLNGLNPGALSLPDTLGTSGTENVNYFNVIGYLNNTGTLATIPSTATYDGWLYINAKDGTESYIIIDDSTASFGTSVFGNNGLGAQGIGLLCLMCPIRKGHAYNVRIKSAGIVSARIYPAQGNV